MSNKEEDWEELVYIPSEVDKAIINGLCSEIIDILSPLTIQQKAFALHTLVSSFEDTANIKLTAIKYKEDSDQ